MVFRGSEEMSNETGNEFEIFRDHFIPPDYDVEEWEDDVGVLEDLHLIRQQYDTWLVRREAEDRDRECPRWWAGD